MAKKQKAKSAKKRFLIFGLILLIVAGIGVYFFTACNEKPELDDLSGSKNYMCKLAGAPEEHSGIDNIGAVIYTLARRDYYSTESYTQVDAAMGVKQYIKGGKDYKDGIMIANTFSWSEASGLAAGFLPADVSLQKFYGAEKAVLRKGAVTPEEWKQENWSRAGFEWNTGDPYEILAKDEYQNTYGVWGTEFADYIVNKETCLEVSEPVEENGLFTVTAKLDPQGATEYYVRQMVTMGGLSSVPEFSEVTMTLTFTEDWSVQSILVEESYSTKKAGISAKCSSTTQIAFSYDEADVDVSAYEEYFSKYADADSTGSAEQEKSGLDYILSGIAPILNEDTSLRLRADFGESLLEGDLFLSLKGLDIAGIAAGGDIDMAQILAGIEVRAKFGDLLAGLCGGDIVLQYKDFCGKLPLAELLGSQSGGTGAQVLAADAAEEKPLFAVSEDWNKDPAYIPAELNIGDVSVKLGFSFEGEGESYRWTKIEAETQALGMDIALSVEPSAGETIPAPDASKAVDLRPYIEEIAALVQGKKYSVGISYADAENHIAVSGTVDIDLSQGDLRIAAKVNVGLGALQIPAEVTVIGRDVWLNVYGFCAKTTLSELGDLLKDLLSDVQMPQSEFSVSVADALAVLLNIDYDKLFAGLSLTDEKLAAELDVSVLAETADALLGTDLGGLLEKAGLSAQKLALEYDKTAGAFALSFAGAELTLGAFGGQIAQPEKFAVTEGVDFTLSGEITLKDEQLLPDAENNSLTIGAQIDGEVRFAEGVQIGLHISLDDLPDVWVSYCDGTITFACGDYWMEVPQSEWLTVVAKFSGLLGAEGENPLAPLMAVLGENGLDLASLFEAIRISTEEGGLGIMANLSAWLGGNAPALDLLLYSGQNGLAFDCASMQFSGVTLRGMTAEIWAENGELTFPKLDASDRCENVFEFILNAYTEIAQAQYIGLDFTYDAPTLSVDLGGRVQLAQAEDSAQVTLYLDFTASIVEYTTDENGATVEKGGHYLHLIIAETPAEAEKAGASLYLTYSTVSLDADMALRVYSPVADLFAAGKTILPILSPLLGISEDVYYFEFVEAILGGYYESINSGIFGVMDTERWCDLLLGIIEEYTPEDGAVSASGSASVSFGSDESGNFVVRVGGISDGKGDIDMAITALKNAEPVSAPADLTGYIDISSLAQLLQDFEYSYNYALGGGYRLTGTVQLDLKLGSLDIISLPVSLDIRVGFEVGDNITDRAPYVYIKTFVPKKSFIVSITDADTMTEIVIRGGNVYMLRNVGDSPVASQDIYREFLRSVNEYHFPQFHTNKDQYYYDVTTRYTYQTTQAEYRAMPLTEFATGGLNGILDQVYFIFNLSSTVQGLINDNLPTGGESQSGTSYDAGQMVNSYYPVKDGEALTGYSMQLNLAAIAGDDTFDTVDITIGRTYSKTVDGVDYYDLTSLNAEMDILGGIFHINMKVKHDAPGSDSQADALSREVIQLFEQNDIEITAGEIASGMVNSEREWSVERTEEQRLCTKCDSGETDHWGMSNWRYDESIKDWVQC